MPCWYYDKKDLRNTPSIRDGIDFDTEARYRREGARFINEAGQKLGLRHDTCATGVVYFHRFYMYHSFREFYRYVIATTCLFLAGKVEETPKKCKDIIKTVRGILPDQQFSLFGSDPKEEVMTMERILLQTIKFDLQVEHPYSFLLKYAKSLRGDKAKIQKMVQMSWTFINDGYCTSLCLQWEPEIIAVSLMYLASRLNKFEITEWQDKPAGYKGKWWDQFIEDMSMELMEDICHQVLDLYSQTTQAQKRAESPPLKIQGDQPPPPPPSRKPQVTPPRGSKSRRDSSNDRDKRRYTPSGDSGRRSASRSGGDSSQPPPRYQGQGESQYVPPPSSESTTAYNPYVSSQMYASSFMNQEGLQNISSLMMSNPPPTSAPPYQPVSSAYGQYPQQYQQQPPVTQQAQHPQHPMYTQPGYHAPPMQPQLQPQQQPMPQYPPQAPQFRGYVPPPQPQPNYQHPAPAPAGYNPGFNQPPMQQYPPQQGYPNQQFMGNQGPPPMPGPAPMPQGPPRHQGSKGNKASAIKSSNLVVLGGARK